MTKKAKKKEKRSNIPKGFFPQPGIYNSKILKIIRLRFS
jgi:hypothetical protein